MRALLARQATLDKPAPAPITPASIATELAGVTVARTDVDVTILRAWEIYELVMANTPRKKAVFKELRAAWNAAESAQARLARAEKALAAAQAAPPPPAPTASKKKKGKKPPDPAAEKAAAAAALEKAEKRVAAATTAIKTFILQANDLVRALDAEKRSLGKRKQALSKTIAGLERRKRPDAAKLKAARDERDTINKRIGELPAARESALKQVQAHSDAISFAPVKTRRNVYRVTVDGVTVRLSDRVEAWPTKFETGLVEHGAAGGTPLHDVVDTAPISASKRKILRAISANESGKRPVLVRQHLRPRGAHVGPGAVDGRRGVGPDGGAHDDQAGGAASVRHPLPALRARRQRQRARGDARRRHAGDRRRRRP